MICTLNGKPGSLRRGSKSSHNRNACNDPGGIQKGMNGHFGKDRGSSESGLGQNPAGSDKNGKNRTRLSKSYLC